MLCILFNNPKCHYLTYIITIHFRERISTYPLVTNLADSKKFPSRNNENHENDYAIAHQFQRQNYLKPNRNYWANHISNVQHMSMKKNISQYLLYYQKN